MSLSTDEIQRLDDDGYLVLPGFMDDSLLTRLRQHVKEGCSLRSVRLPAWSSSRSQATGGWPIRWTRTRSSER